MIILHLCALLSLGAAQFVPPPTDLIHTKGHKYDVRYKQVTNGTCELTPGVKSFSGYVDIAPEQHMFWWFFETRHGNPRDAPLTIWINGGPGSSSMIGLFQELGPCRIDVNGEVYNNPYSWNNESNILFIDHPAQVGFSYSVPVPAYQSEAGSIVSLPNATCPSWADGCGTYSYPNLTDTVNSTLAGAVTMWETLQGFFGAFPQYTREEVILATESYGGHYGPVFNDYLVQQNTKIKSGKLPGAQIINLRAVLIGNGWYDPLINYQAYYNFTVNPGNTYDYFPFNKSIEQQMFNALYGKGNCRDMTADCYATGTDEVCSAADTFCANEVESLLDNIGRDEYDIRYLTPHPFPHSFFTDYLNKPKVQNAIGAFVNYSESSNTVYTAFQSTGDDDREDGTIEAVRRLVAQGIYVVQYYGDADYNCNWLGGQVVADKIAAPGYMNSGFVNFTDSTHTVYGQVRQSANYAFVRIYYAGHMAPFYQPVIALEMLKRAIGGRDIATGRERVHKGRHYCTVGPKESTFREGIETVTFEVLPEGATYNFTTHRPNAAGNGTAGNGRRWMGKRGPVRLG
ncbi:alpha/beta-hydrolase [Piedraia hortae CBS 480.64]|uniref:Carboxypeptidase n=1 Tax=Piedraia hortae CBS 480.64 TaxID=1314780 RepID=A0A6A7BZG8_9PEZI|nr:alpha/beta-hydrolase [Piedraia hortae CBS 480.64]